MNLEKSSNTKYSIIKICPVGARTSWPFFGQDVGVVGQDLMISINAVLLLQISLVGTNGYCQIMNTTNILNLIQWA